MSVISFSDPVSRRQARWVGAAAAITLMHAAALAVVIVGFPDEIVEEPEGSVMLELAALPVSAAVDTPDIPPGPLVEASEQATLKTLEPVPSEDELPEVEPSPLAPEPEVALPLMRAVEPPEERKEPEIETPTPDDPTPAQETVVPQVTAPPPTAAVTPAPSTAAKKHGTTTTVAREEASWQKRIVTELGKHRRYPGEARARRMQGDTMVKFRVDRAGRVVSSAIVKGSGSRHLDDEALALIARAAPLPAPPDDLPGATFDLEIPIRFRIKEN